ncbi:MAG: sugar phosphate nucleotidyltransferase [Ilumatobacteraceae bacterium]
MHAVVLVGGFGTRLRPLTYTTPKPLLPIGDRPMLEHLLSRLARGGITDAVLALGFQPDPFFAAFPGDRCAGVNLSYAVEDTPLDTAGAIGFAARRAGIDSTFVVANGDVMTSLDVASLIDFHRRSGGEATISLTPVEDPSQFGIVEIEPNGLVTRFVEKPAPGESSSNFASAGTYVIEPRSLQRMPDGQKLSIERVVFPAIVGEGALYAMATNDYWIDAGRPDTYLDANLHALHSGATTAIDAAAAVDDDVEVTDAVVGAGAQVGRGASVRRSVILPGAVVGRDAIVSGSLVMGLVGDGAVVIDSVIGKDGVVEAGETLSGIKRPDEPHG